MNFSKKTSINSQKVRHSPWIFRSFPMRGFFSDQMVKTIKENLYELGYNYEQFLQLDEQMKKGSRQLLICLGWLIHHMKLIEKCMRYYLDSISNTDQVGFHDGFERSSEFFCIGEDQAVCEI